MTESETRDVLAGFLRAVIQKRWADYGECQSCGWHALLREYDDSDLETGLDLKTGVVDLPCLSDDEDRTTHLGVRVHVADLLELP